MGTVSCLPIAHWVVLRTLFDTRCTRWLKNMCVDENLAVHPTDSFYFLHLSHASPFFPLCHFLQLRTFLYIKWHCSELGFNSFQNQKSWSIGTNWSNLAPNQLPMFQGRQKWFHGYEHSSIWMHNQLNFHSKTFHAVLLPTHKALLGTFWWTSTKGKVTYYSNLLAPRKQVEWIHYTILTMEVSSICPHAI